MIPDTSAAVLAFLGLVAPGVVYQLRREGIRPAPEETAFREASRIALTSLVFTAVSLGVMSGLTQVWAPLPDLSAWILKPREYAAANLASVALFMALVVLGSCGLALGTARLIRGRPAFITSTSLWYRILRDDVPNGSVRTWLWIVTANGNEFKGPLRTYTPGVSVDDFALALGGSPLEYRASASTPWVDLDAGIDAIVIPGSDIRHFTVKYLDQDGNGLPAQAPIRWWERMRQSRKRGELGEVRPSVREGSHKP